MQSFVDANYTKSEAFACGKKRSDHMILMQKISKGTPFSKIVQTEKFEILLPQKLSAIRYY